MKQLGHEKFYVAGHDRGPRVCHRMALDYPEKIHKMAILDIVPTYEMFKHIDQTMASGYYHWFFLIQDNGLPEHFISLDPDFYLQDKLKRWSTYPEKFDPAVVNDYLRCFRIPDTIHASCEDYRAAASIDLEHDETDLDKLITCPLLVLWGRYGIIGKHVDMLNIWSKKAQHVSGKALDCGHFLAEEAPEETLHSLLDFF